MDAGPPPALDASPDPSIVCVAPERRLEAIQALLRSDRAAAERFLRFAIDHQMRLDGFWGRIDRAGRIIAAVLAAPSAGRTATLFATAARTGQDVRAMAPLIDQACRTAHELNVDLSQALVDPQDTRQLEAFSNGGMTRLASLTYLERPLARLALPEAPTFPPDVRIETWDSQRRDELIATLERTYLDTLDCPALAGLRRGEDILEGHLHSGTFEPALWTVLRFVDGPNAGAPAGVCLLNSSPPIAADADAPGTIELVYFGLIPAARGRRLGAPLLAHAMSLLRGRRETAMVLAVDDRNGPALRIYRDAGFRSRFRRIAFIRPALAPPTQ